jgi:hypothetical protein
MKKFIFGLSLILVSNLQAKWIQNECKQKIYNIASVGNALASTLYRTKDMNQKYIYSTSKLGTDLVLNAIKMQCVKTNLQEQIAGYLAMFQKIERMTTKTSDTTLKELQKAAKLSLKQGELEYREEKKVLGY